MKILVTGGCGYIGSHTTYELIDAGYDVVVVDNLSNSSIESLKRIEKLTQKKIEFFQADIIDKTEMRQIFREHEFYGVIHFAGLKAVSESVKKPNLYYQNNVFGTLCLLEVMSEFNLQNFVFSSSATVYGEEAAVPYVESMSLGEPASPYGATKAMIERILMDTSASNAKFRALSLRYFNPIGAHSSGLIGEDPLGVPNNLLPFISQVAIGNQKKLKIYGKDYSTPDGTCRRDYLHVVDLARGHVQALSWLQSQSNFVGVEAFNLGTGIPLSVLEIVNSFIKETGININYEFVSRRNGDLAEFWADVEKSRKILGWSAKLSLSDMMRDTWNWQSKNPKGYQK